MPDTLPDWTWDMLPDWERTVLQSLRVELDGIGYNSRLRNPDTRMFMGELAIDFWYGIDVWRACKWYNPRTWGIPELKAKICCIKNVLYVELVKPNEFMRVDLFDPRSIDWVLQFVKK